MNSDITPLARLLWRRADPGLVTSRAAEYVNRGWPVAALAVPLDGHCPCGPRKHCEAPHLVSSTITTTRAAAQVWAKGHKWDIAIVTSQFDVIELPDFTGAELWRLLDTSCPTATAGYPSRNTGRFYFVLEAGALPTDQVEMLGGVTHSGPDRWIVAPPTRTEDLGRVEWLIEPVSSRWAPCSRQIVEAKVYNSPE